MITKSIFALGLLFSVGSSALAGDWDTVYVDKKGVQHTIKDSSSFAHSIANPQQERSSDSYVGLNNAVNEFDANLLNPMFGGVIGKYPRSQITSTTFFPFSAIGQIRFKQPNGNWARCSGTLVGLRHVLTAAHCVYTSKAYNSNETNTGWHTEFTFYPGRNGDQDHYGQVNATTALTVVGYTDKHDWRFDYAMLILDSDIGDYTGWLAYGYSGDIPNMNLFVGGYPGDKPDGTQWLALCPVDKSNTTDEVIAHQCDQYGGQSGGPTYLTRKTDDKRIIYGPNIASSQNLPVNYAKRITSKAFERIDAWVKEN